MITFRLYPGLKLSLEHNSARKNLFLSARFSWDSRFSLRQMDQKLNIRTRNRIFFIHSKRFRLHAKLNDAAVAVESHSGKDPGYCKMIGRGRKSCFFCHVTGLLFFAFT